MTAAVTMSLSSTNLVSTVRKNRFNKAKSYTQNMTSLHSLDATLVHDSLREVLNGLMLPSSRTKAINNDCISAIVKAMELHPTSEAVQGMACLVLERMAEIQGPCASSACTHQCNCITQAMIEERVSSVLVQAMTTFPLSLNIQQSAIEALKMLAAVKGFNESAQELEVISAVLSAMKKHSVVECIQRSALEALTALADSCASKITESKGVEAIVDAMSQYSDTPAVQTRACLALGTLASKNPQSQETIVAVGGIEAIVAAMSTNLESMSMQIEAFGTLEKLALGHPGHVDRITEAGGIQLIMDAIQKHSDSTRLHNCARTVLMALTQTE